MRIITNVRGISYIRSLEMKIRDLTAQLAAPETATTSRRPNPDADDDEYIVSAVQSETFAAPTREGHWQGTDRAPASNEPGNTAIEEEITDVNQHTNTVEFHGSTSSMALLESVQRQQSQQIGNRGRREPSSLVSALHNPAFSPGTGQVGSEKTRNIYFPQAHIFIEAYFENLHFIHPLIDKEGFMARANDMWSGQSHPGSDTSFTALYLSLMSLGALVRVWDEERLNGLTRFEWSRKLFREAQDLLHDTQFANDLDTVQCLYFMVSDIAGKVIYKSDRILQAKICQNELNPHLAYMYLGLAVRTCLSAGFNRESPYPKQNHSDHIAKTWWGIYSLEVEMSFSLGRPDCLGMNEYHNRTLPSFQDTEFAIIPAMVDFAQIIRRVSISIYHRKLKWQEKIRLASQIETELDQWVVSLPEKIRPFTLGRRAIGALKEPKWCRRQRLVLNIRK
jgi:Fungal specific transcription factor domain